MKKLSFIILALLGILFPVNAQNRFNIYQENVVIKQIRTSDVDSITVSETSPHIVSFWHKGSVSHSFDTEEIDSITTSHDDDPLSYMGIVGFNDALYIKNIDVLAKSTAGFFRSFVSSLPRKDGTLLYYAVDNAMDKLNSKEISTPLSSVNMITFTDGLDQGSIMMNPRYSSSASYLNAMSELIRKSEFNGLPINAYAVGLRGNDVSDMTTFRNNLARLASSADKSFEVGSVSDLRTKFQDIANQIISVSTRQTISLKIPGIDSGTRVRFVFDGQSAESSGLYIEGTFNLSDRTLRNVTYHGMKSRSGSMVQGTQDGIFVTFTFMGLQREEVGQTIPTNIRHYYKLPSSSAWQQNSEFTPDNNTQRTVSHSGTIVMLVLDCSGSLGSDFDKVKQYANEFIDMIANNAQQCEVKAPENAKAELNGKDFTIVVSWDVVKNAESYQVYRSSSSGGTYSLVADKVVSTIWTDQTPLSGNNYYRIKAIGHGLTSGNSNTTNVVEYKLDAPANAKVVWNDNDDVVVSWDTVKYAEGYQVYRSSSSGGSYTIVADNVNSSIWKDNDPRSGYNYYRVKAIGHGLTSGYSNTTELINYVIETPVNVKAKLDDENFNIVVSWDAVKHAEFYQVSRNGSVVVENITSTSWIDKSPIAGINNYQIRAIGHGLVSDFSNIVMLWGKSGTFNGYGYVDLGLPSGTLWATINVGASKPEEYGDYFAWGETEGYDSGKTTFNLSTYKWCKGSDKTMTKYCNNSRYGYNGFTDNKTELDPEDDAAYVNWGSGWRMPSEAQYRELINSSYTTTIETTVNGVTGQLITSKINGNSIFLPAAGYRNGTSLSRAGSRGDYGSRTLYSGLPSSAWSLDFFSSSDVSMGLSNRHSGQSIRPVRSTE